MTECTLKKYTLGNYNKGPQIMGFTSSETVAFAGSKSIEEISSEFFYSDII